jgi:hypothetical protein
MEQIVRVLDSENITEITANFHASLAEIGTSIKGKTGITLFTALKREKLVEGPYPGVSLFEAANRIMSDLVILGGVSCLLKDRLFPFTTYTVEFGNEDNNGFDIRSKLGSETLVGEAFNVAPSFFTRKKGDALGKLRRNGSAATYRILMYNDDAVSKSYSPKSEFGLHHVLVGIESGTVQLLPKPKVCYVSHPGFLASMTD